MRHKKQSVALNKQKKRLRQKQRERQSRQLAPAKLSRKLTERLGDAYDLIRCGDYDKAEELLQKLDRRGSSYPKVVEALMILYQTTGDRESCCEAAERLTKLCPRDAEARIMYAQESMYCGRASIALLNYQEFINCWPDHPHVSKAKQAIEILVPETERRMKETPFPSENALLWCCLHEESLALLHRGKYADCVAKCKDLLAKAPNFASARNNMAIACFQCGHAKEAIAVVEETRRMLPDNRFAEATLAKLYFLTGRVDDAHQLADQLVDNPPSHQDSIVTALEALAFLGRDEDVVQLAEATVDEALLDEQSKAIRLHYVAYAKCRLGDKDAAKVTWKQCSRFKHLMEARENLDDLKSGEGHAPWGASFGKWVPKATMDQVIESMRGGNDLVLARNPGLASLIPALLDRGDPLGREAAMRLAMADQSPPMLDALKDFAFGSRGPDALRFEALQFLRERKVIDAGPHHIYSRGEWTDIQLLAAKITGEPRPSSSSARVLELLEDGFYSMRENDFETAESAFSQALAEEPGNCSAAYNLCALWMRRDGEKGKQRAIPRLEQLHRDHPDYPFAAIALAQLAAADGEFQRARDLLAPCYKVTQLHISEATALFAAQAQVALAESDIDAAERAFDMLCEIADEDDPQIMAVRYCIDRASGRKGLRGLFSW
jgi:predicted Zn-dependent protease